jgi:hypothetical protein
MLDADCRLYLNKYKVIKKSLCTWLLQYIRQVYREFSITLYKVSNVSLPEVHNVQIENSHSRTIYRDRRSQMP